MLYLYFILVIIILNVFYDLNYVFRTLFTLLSGRIYERQCLLNDETTIYGVCTFQDCDVFFKSMRLARIIRELDFARFHFHDRTGVYRVSKREAVNSAQRSTLTLCMEPIRLFEPYKIVTKLVYWDEHTLFFEHKVITLWDNRVRYFLVSRQYAMERTRSAIDLLLKDLPGCETPKCPDYITHWLNSMNISSVQLRNNNA